MGRLSTDFSCGALRRAIAFARGSRNRRVELADRERSFDPREDSRASRITGASREVRPLAGPTDAHTVRHAGRRVRLAQLALGVTVVGIVGHPRPVVGLGARRSERATSGVWSVHGVGSRRRRRKNRVAHHGVTPSATVPVYRSRRRRSRLLRRTPRRTRRVDPGRPRREGGGPPSGSRRRGSTGRKRGRRSIPPSGGT